jgi:hypothetical protein
MNQGAVVDGWVKNWGLMLEKARAKLLEEAGIDLTGGDSYAGLVQQTGIQTSKL